MTQHVRLLPSIGACFGLLAVTELLGSCAKAQGARSVVSVSASADAQEASRDPRQTAIFRSPTAAVEVGASPTSMPYLGKMGSAVLSIHSAPTHAAGDSAISAIRADLVADGGGGYGHGIQTAYSVFNAESEMGTEGQAIGYWAYVNGRGKGNAMFGNAVVNCYGGGGVDPTTDGTPECSPLGEFEAQTGTLVFQAQLDSAPSQKSGTFRYAASTARNENVLGNRYVLNRNRSHTSGWFDRVDPANSRRLIFDGPTNFRDLEGAGSWYVKIGSLDDLYEPPCAGDDVPIDGKCIGHWYKVERVDGPSSLVIDMHYDSVGLTTRQRSPYLLRQGSELRAFDTIQHTLSFAAVGTERWSAGDIVYSPPNHIVAWNGLNLIFHKTFKTGAGTVASNGIRLANYGPGLIDRAIWITGHTGTREGGYRNGIVFNDFNGDGTALDMSRTDVGTALAIKSSDGNNNKIVIGNTGQIFHDGKSVVVGGAPLQVAGGALTIAKGDVTLLAPGKGVILKSPNGAICKRLGLDDRGALVVDVVSPCP